MTRVSLAFAFLLALGACAAPPPVDTTRIAPPPPQFDPELSRMYGAVADREVAVPAVPPRYLSQRNKRQRVDYWSDEPPGTIVVDPYERFLYLVQENDTALRYGIAVGEAGRQFSGEATIPYQRDWPSWTPTRNMIEREPEVYGPFAGGQDGSLENPLGARALYLHRGGEDTLYRIHGTSQPWSIGQAASSGCIRLYNQDIIDLADRVRSGTKVVVLTQAQSGQGTRLPGSLPTPSLGTELY
ncbi:lipoprotein-anchoring transpeptidase ErfK/SrfK [Palleronia aestuarii]|uniref:Lipoprotein-anchoring transpeptidase ErfK/SrfK n=1 Tax=Palleronia aestuarii TaxID=568105 RepID=A0A2W7MXA0_9RHOB|nr:L,D-transpeptidase [Palleronia aestuarii]PZX12785.1 lipoprotein-anchoring transpeptidase ErfK/SrfK [Palleronia aestuarii]